MQHTQPATGRVPPAPLGLVGRVREREEVAERLAGARLVTLIGAGGCGKTRLALEVANDAAPRFSAGAAWVDLGPLQGPAMVPTAVAAAVGVHQRASRDLVETLVGHLDGVNLLLVLDNCEHLIDACAALVTSLLRGCPQLSVLATSREPLSVRGEVSYLVPGLTVPEEDEPTPASVARSECAQLFELRARQVRSGFRITGDNAVAVARICRGLDGIPLAIELAAARVRVLSPQQIADGLADRFGLLTRGARDAPTRQRSLAASVRWSYDLLTAAQRHALTRLSVFVSSFELTAAEHVAAGPDLAAGDVLELVTDLVDRSLLQVTEVEGAARYRMLETIREYAWPRLAEVDQPSRVRDRHLDHFVDLAQRAQPSLLGPDPEGAIAQLRTELDDLRAAMDWAVASRRGLDVIDIVEATFTFWMVQGLYVEMSRRLQAAVEALPPATEEGARGLMAASLLTMMGGDHPAGHALADEAVRLSASSGDDRTLARALIYRAWCGSMAGCASGERIAADLEEGIALAGLMGEEETRLGGMMFSGTLDLPGRSFAEGHDLLERAVAEMERTGFTYLHTIGTTFLAARYLLPGGDPERAAEHAEAALLVARRLGLHSFVSTALSVLGGVATLRGEEHAAGRYLGEALTIAEQGGLRSDVMVARDWLALAADRFGTPAEAREAAEVALVAAREVGSRPFEASAQRLLGVVALREQHLAPAHAHLAQARELSSEPCNVFTLGRSLLALAQLAAADEAFDRARERAHEGLEVLVEHQDRPGIADALETLAAIQTDCGQPEPALRLLAATHRLRRATGIGRFPVEAALVARSQDRAGGQLTADEVEDRRHEGAAMSLDEAVAYARRGRGERARPPSGWDALTPAERDVVRYVAQGRSNTEVAAQLFVSVNTVKTHLSHVYAKVQVEGRSELIAEAAHRAL